MFYEFQHFGISEHFCKEYGENFSFPIHLHQSFELITIFEGEMTVKIDTNEYLLKKGDSVLIFPNQLHSLESCNSRHMLCIFSPELVKAYSPNYKKRKPVDNRFFPDSYIINALDKISDDSSSIQKKGVLYSICAEFDKNASYTENSSFEDNILQKIFEFVGDNYNKDCELNDLAKKTGYSYSYLSRCFKTSTGISFNTYVNYCRINNACYLLNNTDYSILQCALESGYKSTRSFNRNFMTVLSVTPKEYRETAKTKSTLVN